MLYANGYPVGGGGGSDTGGHTIIDEDGNSMSARAGLQFIGGANVSDDATNNRTIVDISGGGGFGLVQSGHTVYTLTGQNLEVTIPITFDTPFPEVPNVALSLSDSSRGQFYNPQTGLGVMAVTKTGFNILLKSSSSAVAGNITIYWIATTKFSGNGIFHPTIYSTEEREIGVWTNGKPLYQKTFEILNPSSTSGNIDISLLNVEEMINRHGSVYRNSSPIQQKEIEYRTESPSDANYGFVVELRGSNLYWEIFGYPYSQIEKMSITLQYTKSTDVAGSGTWTPDAIPAVHYSTEEHVVGTNYDGKTLYEKILTTPTSTSGNDRHFDISGLDDVYIEGGFVDIGTAKLPLNIVISSLSNQVYTFYDAQNSTIICGIVGWTPTAFKIIIRYTKSS